MSIQLVGVGEPFRTHWALVKRLFGVRRPLVSTRVPLRGGLVAAQRAEVEVFLSLGVVLAVHVGLFDPAAPRGRGYSLEGLFFKKKTKKR